MTVQVDSSLYSIPSAFNVQKWVDSVPKGYVFHFKAFGLFCGSTQGCPTNALPRRVREQLASYLLAKPTVTLKDLPDHAVKSIWAAFGACVEPAVKACFSSHLCPENTLHRLYQQHRISFEFVVSFCVHCRVVNPLGSQRKREHAPSFCC